MTSVPRCGRAVSAHNRPTKSVPLPGAKGTISRIGLSGNLRFDLENLEKSAAFAVEGTAAAASPSARKSRRLIVDLSTSSPLLPSSSHDHASTFGANHTNPKN